jgi:hypothetical protein
MHLTHYIRGSPHVPLIHIALAVTVGGNTNPNGKTREECEQGYLCGFGGCIGLYRYAMRFPGSRDNINAASS